MDNKYESNLALALLSVASFKINHNDPDHPETGRILVKDAYLRFKKYGGPIFAATLTLEATKMYENSKDKSTNLFCEIVEGLYNESDGLIKFWLHKHPEFYEK